MRSATDKNKNMEKIKSTCTGTIVKAAAVQISPVLYSRDGTVEKVVKKICELGRKDVRFATFPEAFVPIIRILLLTGFQSLDPQKS